MIIITKITSPTVTSVIDMGRQGENEAREVWFDLTWLIETYGEGTATVLCQRSRDDAPYLATITQEGKNAIWRLTNLDTAYDGYGKCELRWTVGDTLAKTIIYKTVTLKSMAQDAEVPDAYQSWYDQMIEYINDHAASPEQIAEAVEDYIDTHPITGAVVSVNGETGEVTLTAEDVGALPDSTVIPTRTSDLTNDSGFITGYTETDPTVPAWAKSAQKPTYTAQEVGALPSDTAIPTKTSDLTNDSGFGTYTKPSGGIPKTDLASAVQTSLDKADTALQSYTETDPTVPSWAKASTKPSYTAAEVGALPSSTAIPSVDSTLSVTGAAADAKATGDEINQLKEDYDDIDDRVTALEGGGSGSGLTDDIKQALLQMARKVAYIDADGQDYYDDLYDALYAVTAIRLDANSIMLTSIGSTQQLTATTTPAGGAVTWASSNTSIATVSSTGLVTSVGYGSCTITASSGSVSATCAVAVSQVTLTSIAADYQQSGTVYDTASLDSLKNDLTVTATYSDSSTATVTEYTLSGTLTVGTSTITASYGGKTATFNVTVTAAPTLSSISAVYTQSGTVYDTDTLDSLKDDLVVTAHYSDSTSQTVADYTLSGTLAEGTSTITVSYGGKTATFTVTVTQPYYPKTLTYTDDGVGFGSVDSAKPTQTPPYVANTYKNRVHLINTNGIGYPVEAGKTYKIAISNYNAQCVGIQTFNTIAQSNLENRETVDSTNKADTGWLAMSHGEVTFTPTDINGYAPACVWINFKKNAASAYWTDDVIDTVEMFPITISVVP